MIDGHGAERAPCPDDELGVAAAAGRSILANAQGWAHDHLVPLNATVEITQRCNIRCRHCYNFDRGEVRGAKASGRDAQAAASCHATGDARPELTTPELLGLFGDLHAAGCLFLNLTGGEALLHPDLFVLLDRAAELNFSVGLLTNGVLLRPGMAGDLARYPNLLRVGVSVYGASAAVHDGITQASGSFARTWRGVEALRARGVSVKVKFVIMRDNAHEAAAMLALAEQHQVPYGVDMTTTVRHDGDRGSLSQRLTLEQVETLSRGPLRGFLPTGRARAHSDASFACNCARGNCAITARGDVQPCISVPMVAGNIKDRPFAEIWRDSKVFTMIRQLRIADYAACAPCPHQGHCTRDRGAAFTYSGSYTGTDPLVCARAQIAHTLADTTD
jgi:radical SAM protein with 4Fe4S-binding SPASM domain